MVRSCVIILAVLGVSGSFLGMSQANDTTVTNKAHVWVGSEDLEGYGRLEFQFYSGGRVVMIDARETVDGTFSRSGDSITLSFPGVATYSGYIRGNNMSGTGRDDKGTWNFSVQYQGQR
jgi:hypothetical protein